MTADLVTAIVRWSPERKTFYFVGPDGDRYVLGGDDFTEGEVIRVQKRLLETLKGTKA